jgi:muconolactone delta-isomerase
MKILAIERAAAGANEELFRRLREEEARVAWHLYQEGLVRELYFRADRPEAVLVLECASLEEAHQVVARLPMAAAGLIDFELIPLAAYPGFARLFRQAGFCANPIDPEGNCGLTARLQLDILIMLTPKGVRFPRGIRPKQFQSDGGIP